MPILIVIPVWAGIYPAFVIAKALWIPAYAGMTERKVFCDLTQLKSFRAIRRIERAWSRSAMQHPPFTVGPSGHMVRRIFPTIEFISAVQQNILGNCQPP
jgi:hypothetical protein